MLPIVNHGDVGLRMLNPKHVMPARPVSKKNEPCELYT